jgi:uncharacterized membrane protein
MRGLIFIILSYIVLFVGAFVSLLNRNYTLLVAVVALSWCLKLESEK